MKYIYYLFAAVALLATSLCGCMESVPDPMETTTEVLPMFIRVTDEQIGVHIADESQKEFNFGSTLPGTAVIKTMKITRGDQPPAVVSISVNGSIASWLELSENNFLLDDQKQIEVTVNVPTDASEGTYTGSLMITYKQER